MIKEGQKAPKFNLPNQNGEDTSLSDFLGKKVVLWFSPKLALLDEQLKDKGSVMNSSISIIRIYQ